MIGGKETEVEENIAEFNDFLRQLQRDYIPNKSFDYDRYFDSLNTVADFVYVINYLRGDIVFSKGLDTYLGFKDTIYNQASFIRQMYLRIHPEDICDVILYTTAATKVSANITPDQARDSIFVLDYRIKKKNGEYARVLRQSSALEVSPKGGLESVIALCTDISKMKMNGSVTARFEGSLKDDFYDLVKKEKAAISDKLSSPILSAREQEVLHLISKGMRSQDISEKLFVSVHTVNTHRRNMLKKLKVKTMSELMMKVLA